MQPCNWYLWCQKWQNTLNRASLSEIQTEVDQVDLHESVCLIYSICGVISLLLQLIFIILCNKPEQQAKHAQAVHGSQNSNRAGGKFNWEWRGRWQSVGRQSGEPAIRPAVVAEITTVIINTQKQKQITRTNDHLFHGLRIRSNNSVYLYWNHASIE